MPINFREISFLKRVVMVLGMVILSAPAAIHLIDNYTRDLSTGRAWAVLSLAGVLNFTKHLSKSYIKDNQHPNLIYVANFLVAGAAGGIHVWSVCEIISSDSSEPDSTNTVKTMKAIIVDNGEEETPGTDIQEDDTTEKNEEKGDIGYYIAILVFNILCLNYHLLDVFTAKNEASIKYTGSQDLEMSDYVRRRY